MESEAAHGSEKQPALKSLNERHREIIRLLATGRTTREVMEELNVSRYTVSRARNCPKGREFLAELRDRLDTETVRRAASVIALRA